MSINYGKQFIDNDDIAAVTKVLRSNFLTSGPTINEFENKLLNKFNYRAIAVNSGTAALHAALFAADIGKGDEVIVPAITFLATANAVLYCGAKPVFADVDKDTLLIDINNVSKLITEKTKAIIAVDYAGQQANYLKLSKICKAKKIMLIADACHSFGAINNVADFVCFSFHPVKHITTGEGGAVLIKNASLYSKIKAFINHGRYESLGMVSTHIGYNYKMSEIAAALGLSQMNKIDKFIQIRKEISSLYFKELEYCSLPINTNNVHVHHLYVIKVKNRFSFMQNMKKDNINCGIHYIPVYIHPLYDEYRNESIKNCKNAEIMQDVIVSLPIYYSLTDKEILYVIEKVKQYNPM